MQQRSRSFRVVVITACAAIAGVGPLASSCTPPVEPLAFEEGCNPLLADVDCGLPYPSDFFLVDDASLPSGHRVHFSGKAKLFTQAGRTADVTDFMPQDGFSRHAPIVVSFGVAVDPTSVPGYFDDPTATTTAGAKTALVDASTGERIPHFIDVDPRATDLTRQALIMRPLVQLRANTRYVVALSGVHDTNGATIAPHEAFRRLRDAAVGEDVVLKPLLARYETDVFPVVTAAGIARGDVQLAWDFTTGSDEHVVTDMLRARQLVIDELARTPPIVVVDGLFEGSNLQAVLGGSARRTWRLVTGTITAPRVVTTDEGGAVLFRDVDGQVALNGTTTFEFTAVIPDSVRDSFAPGGVVGFGHGFFGERDEVEDSSTRALADAAHGVMFAIDWQGMSNSDIGTVTSSVGDIVSESLRFGERVPQAMMNWIALTTAVRTGLFDDASVATASGPVAAFRRPASGAGVVVDPNDPTRDNAGALCFDATRIGFVGISQGHILGGVLSALDPDIQRSVLQVGGAAFAHMMYRARPFEGFLFLLKNAVPDALDQQKLAAHFQREFDRFDPATYAPYVLHDALPLGPAGGQQTRRVLLQMGLGDSQVPNLGAHLHARYLGIPQVTPSAGDAIFGVSQQPAPVEGSGLFAYDLGVDASFAGTADFPEQTIVHDSVRRTPEAQAQVGTFLQTGVIENPCDGPCGVVDTR